MFMIRSNQIKAFERSSRADFEDEMMQHCRELFPHLGEALGGSPLRVVVQQAVTAAEAHGFTNRGPARLFVDLTLLFGVGFDSDPRYPWAAELLASDELTEQTHRAEALYERACEQLRQNESPPPVRDHAAPEQPTIANEEAR